MTYMDNMWPLMILYNTLNSYLSGYQEYRGAPAGEGGVKAGTGMAHQMMERAFTATAQGPAAGKAESINPVSAR
ncbi:hypothetical protein DSO57_1013544 [Entomophthora muscae]|uniref:Uncharacterized protein n=1 Tax=Entomophthora muscae TaxID=34485 RepID=A0ACC2URD3_9FUNG|nr:hypothetical protein DSO57_1013544 [Entomophthora muscae]